MKYALFPIFALLLVGCTGLGMFSGFEHSKVKDSVTLVSPRTDILEVIESVGKSLKFEIYLLDKENNAILLKGGRSMVNEIGVGKVTRAEIMVTVREGGKRLDISVFVEGNFGTGGQQAALKLLQEFTCWLCLHLPCS
ncbi:hypothetical protein HYW72_00440 [Candidatus Nomurabacteria bacterium]|nr:hypothetical protein [Candidatus Nomurabacteria bacterium]